MNKILLIRFSSIGDIVLTTPVIRSIKNQLKCELHVLTKEKFSVITKNNPFVDKVHTFQKTSNEVISALKKERFEFVVDLQKNARSLKIRRILGVPSHSFPKLNKQKWLMVNFKINRLPDQHIVDRYFKAVEPIGVRYDGAGLDYFINEEDKIDPETLSVELKKGYVGFVIGGMHNTKKLPKEKIVEIIDKLNLPVVLLGGEEDRDLGEMIVKETTPHHVFNMCGSYSLNQSASLVEQARVIITNDTGLMHIAAAFKKPIISIWGNTIPGFGMYPYLPFDDSKSVFAEVAKLSCRPCSKLGYRKCPKKHFKCMMDQDIPFIVENANRFFH